MSPTYTPNFSFSHSCLKKKNLKPFFKTSSPPILSLQRWAGGKHISIWVIPLWVHEHSPPKSPHCCSWNIPHSPSQPSLPISQQSVSYLLISLQKFVICFHVLTLRWWPCILCNWDVHVVFPPYSDEVVCSHLWPIPPCIHKILSHFTNSRKLLQQISPSLLLSTISFLLDFTSSIKIWHNVPHQYLLATVYFLYRIKTPKSRAVENKTVWTLLIHKVARSQSWFRGT